ncbi:MAG: hypothetical protein QM728_00185 [Gordonia sp. (in: high G+C Gram-positive bacteria)]|uniref:hypothetical protein n=1 Tax=Gordonia sp. (in: high G+C Gram-positive bacteria) TaxID=84139 RepID=UPI0039E3E7E9
MSAQLQLNGLVMLYAYLQRIYVYDKVLATIPDRAPEHHDPASPPELTTLIEKTGKTIAAFPTESGLSDEQVDSFTPVVDFAQAAMSNRAAHPGTPLREQLAAVAGARFHNQHLVEGLIMWGDNYRPETADQYRQRVLPARNDTRLLTAFVAKASLGQLPEEEQLRVGEWYDAVIRTTPGVDGDMGLITSLLRGIDP